MRCGMAGASKVDAVLDDRGAEVVAERLGRVSKKFVDWPEPTGNGEHSTYVVSGDDAGVSRKLRSM